MTTHRPVPSEVDPQALRDLIDDARCLPPEALPRPRTVDVDLAALDPYPQDTPRIPEPTARWVADLDDYV